MKDLVLCFRGAAIAAYLFITFCSAATQATPFAETIGQPSPVFRWSTDRCDDQDIPDAPIRALHLVDSTVLAFDSHFNSRRFLGGTLDSIRRDCAVVYKSPENADPAASADR